MHRWKFSALASAACLCAALTSPNAAALALGTISVQSHLGQPLRAEVDIPQLSAAEAATLQTTVATADIFQAHGMEYNNAARTLQIELQRSPDGTAKLKLSTSAPVNEPFVDIVLQANWNAGNLVRSYTLLLDPVPTAQSAKPSTPAQVRTPAQTGRTYQSQPRVRETIPTQAAPAPASTAAAPTTSDSVTVRAGDTAGRIAAAHRPAGVSLDQMLVAMLQHNPNAFIQGNVNRIRAGAVIKLPSQEQAQSTSAQEARKIIAAQSRDFNAFRQKLAGRTSDAQLEAADRSAAGKVQAQIEDRSPTAAPADKLTLSKGAVAAQNEERLAQQKQAAAQQERMQELQRNLSELESLNSTSNSAQKAADTVDAAAAPSAAAAAAPTDNAASGGLAVEANVPATTAEPPKVDMPAAAATAPAAATAEGAAAEPKPRRRPVAPPPPPPEPSFLESLLENPLVPAGGAAALLLLGLLAWRSRKQKAASAASNADVAGLDSAQLPPDSLFDSSGGQQVDTSSDAPASTMAYSPSQLDANGDVDPIAEADVYLAYGKEEEAQKILREALRNTPNRIPVHLKLAEIHAKKQELSQLEAVARTIHRLTQGEGSDWEQVRNLGRNADPSNPFYADASPAAADNAPSSSFAQALAASASTAEAATAQTPASESATELPDLNLDFDLGNSTPANSTEETTDQFIAALDSQLDIHAPQSHSELPSQIIDTQFAQDLLTPEPSAPSALAAADPELDALELDLSDLNLDLPGSGETTPATSSSIEAAPASADTLDTLDGLDFSLDTDLGLPLQEPAQAPASAPATPAPTTSLEEEDFGLSRLDLGELGEDFSGMDSAASEKLEEAPAGDAADALGTKLDLAQEFAAIGDSEGARSLIEEVLAEASGLLKVRAEKMLSELD